MTTTEGRFSALSVAMMSRKLVSAASATGAREAQTIRAQAHLVGGFFAGDVDDALARLSASSAPACNSTVDLPMPGSPPTRSAEPGTSPPPVTRSSSAMPVEMRGGGSPKPSRSMRARSRGRARRPMPQGCPGAALRGFLDDGVPLTARFAPARPFGRDGPQA